MDVDAKTTVVAFAGALLVLAAIVWLVGVEDVVAALAMADPLVLLATVGVAGLWLVAWGLTLYSVLAAVGTPVGVGKAVVLYAAAVFANNVTPFGQAGGEPVTALLITSATDGEYETGLAAIASVDTLNFVPSVALSVVGFAWVLASAVELTRNLVVAAVGVVVLVLALPVGAYVGWRYRYEVEAVVVRAITPLIRGVARVVPRATPPTPALIERRIEGFFTAIDRVAADRETLLTALAFSALGWLGLCTALWLSVFALGYVVPFPAVLVVVPLGSIAGMTPLPGGLGGVEVAFASLLYATTAVPFAAATAAVLVYRGATYWIPIVAGGGAAALLGASSRR